MERPTTPSGPSAHPPPQRSPPTPEVTRRIEENRLRAKALRDQREQAEREAGTTSTLPRTSSGFINTADVRISSSSVGGASAKRPFSEISSSEPTPATNRDGRKPATAPDAPLRAAKNFEKYVDYNISAMKDTKGGFLTAEDDPFNPAFANAGGSGELKPKHMTQKEWERLQTIRNLQRLKSGPFEPGISVLQDPEKRKKCRECGSFEIDWVWEDVFKCCVCSVCKEKFPEKYSLLTKTECREDYLLTDEELRDEELLPHLNKPNPHKSHWHDMMLFLRFQVEEYAFTQKWGSAEALDAEFEKREAEKKKRKETKFKQKLLDLKKKTRSEAVRRQAGTLGGGRANGGTARFGDQVGQGAKHVHNWGRTVENEDGMTVKTCLDCGMEVEELEF